MYSFFSSFVRLHLLQLNFHQVLQIAETWNAHSEGKLGLGFPSFHFELIATNDELWITHAIFSSHCNPTLSFLSFCDLPFSVVLS